MLKVLKIFSVIFCFLASVLVSNAVLSSYDQDLDCEFGFFPYCCVVISDSTSSVDYEWHEQNNKGYYDDYVTDFSWVDGYHCGQSTGGIVLRNKIKDETPPGGPWTDWAADNFVCREGM